MEKNSKKIFYLSIAAVIFVLAALFLLGKGKPNISKAPPAATGSSQPPEHKVFSPVRPVKHIFIVLEENVSFESVIGNTKDMPYLNSLARSYAYSTNYFASKHPSIANYFTLTTGKTISTDNDFKETVNENNLARIFIGSGKAWKEYSESLPEAGYIGGDEGPYRRHHNPFSYFSDVRETEEQRNNLVPLEMLAKDIKENKLPDYALIVPDNRHNLHDCESGLICTAGEKRVVADNWLKENIEPLLESPAFSQPGGGLLIITADEGSKLDYDNGGGHTFWIAAGPDVKKEYVSDAFYQHENTLHFTLEHLGINDFPGKAKDAASMSEFLEEH